MPSPTAPSPRQALIVAHGQPSDPDGPEAEIAALAGRVGGLLPDWRVAGTTLAMPGGIARAADGVKVETPGPLVFPFFMADGWFIRSLLPRRLAEAGLPGARVLTPFGLLPDTAALALDVLDAALAERGWRAGEVTLVLAAHGSGRSRKPAAAAESMRASFAAARGFAEVRLGFIEEPPSVAQALANAGARALLLPLFVARWGHVESDLPEAVAQSRFAGGVLAPLGTGPGVEEIVARAIATAAG